MLKEALTNRLYGLVLAMTKKAAPGGMTLNGYHIPTGTRLTVRGFNHAYALLIAYQPHSFKLKLYFLLVMYSSNVSHVRIL